MESGLLDCVSLNLLRLEDFRKMHDLIACIVLSIELHRFVDRRSMPFQLKVCQKLLPITIRAGF
jgi:hypothetical protein